MASAEGSVTTWLHSLAQEQDQRAAANIWGRYVDQLVRLARQRLRHAPRRAADEDDVVACAFENFFRGVRHGRFTRLSDRNDLWQILVMLTDRRAKDALRRERARGKWEIDEGALAGPGDGSAAFRIDRLATQEPDAEFAYECTEQLRHLLDALRDDRLCRVAIARLEGYTNDEIASRMNCSLRTVERKLKTIRACWLRSKETS